jgi:hypothetical protein
MLPASVHGTEDNTRTFKDSVNLKSLRSVEQLEYNIQQASLKIELNFIPNYCNCVCRYKNYLHVFPPSHQAIRMK